MQANNEKLIQVPSGWVMLVVNLLILLGGLALTINIAADDGPKLVLLLSLPMIVLGGA